MTILTDYIAERTALGKMAQNVIVASPSGEEILFFIDPTGPQGSTSDVDYLYRAIVFEGEVRLVGYGPGVADGSLLNVVLTAQGPAVEYEFHRGGIYQVTVLPFSANGFPDYKTARIDTYTEADPDMGIAIFGDDGRDDIVGTDLNDVLRGEGGSDTLEGGAGDDLIYGGLGRDTVSGGQGDDSLYGNNGMDRLFGGAGDDYMHGGNGADALFGGDGNDLIFGGNSNDKIHGGNGADDLRGGNGHDTLFGGDGDDVLRGNAGRDRLDGGRGDDKLFGGLGNDTLTAGAGDDVLKGDDGRDVLFGGAGSDRLFGGDGDDRLSAGIGDDLLAGGEGSDVFIFIAGDDVVTDFKASEDTIQLTVSGGAANRPSLEQVGSDVVISYGNVVYGMSEVTLIGVDLSQLHEGNFLF